MVRWKNTFGLVASSRASEIRWAEAGFSDCAHCGVATLLATIFCQLFFHLLCAECIEKEYRRTIRAMNAQFQS